MKALLATVLTAVVLLITSQAEAMDITVQRVWALNDRDTQSMVTGAFVVLSDMGLRCPAPMSGRILKATMDGLIQSGKIEKQTPFGEAVMRALGSAGCEFEKEKSNS